MALYKESLGESHYIIEKIMGTRADDRSLKTIEMREGRHDHELLITTNQGPHLGMADLEPYLRDLELTPCLMHHRPRYSWRSRAKEISPSLRGWQVHATSIT